MSCEIGCCNFVTEPDSVFLDWFQLVFSSSATVYGWPKEVPCTEEFPLSAASPYGRTKVWLKNYLGYLSDTLVGIAKQEFPLQSCLYFGCILQITDVSYQNLMRVLFLFLSAIHWRNLSWYLPFWSRMENNTVEILQPRWCTSQWSYWWGSSRNSQQPHAFCSASCSWQTLCIDSFWNRL